MRRIIHLIVMLATIAGSTLLAVSTAAVAAQSDGLADLGLPELEITATASEFTGIPDQMDAGRYLITISVESDVEFGAGVEFMQPVGISVDELIEFLSAPPDATAAEVAADATPFPEEIATPAEDEGEMDAPPDFYYESVLAGGMAALAGESGQAVVDLTPGEWVAWGGDPEAQQAPLTFEVVGEMPADLPEPEADATITMDEYTIEVSEGELVAGSQVIRVDNVGEQPHFVLFVRGPETMTEEQVAAVLDIEMEAEMTGTEPEFTDLNPDEDLEFLTFTGTQSTDTTLWLELDLEAGMHVMVCFVPDQEDGAPHAYHDMYTVVEVSE